MGHSSDTDIRASRNSSSRGGGGSCCCSCCYSSRVKAQLAPLQRAQEEAPHPIDATVNITSSCVKGDRGDSIMPRILSLLA